MRIIYKLFAGICGVLLVLTLIPCLIWYGAVNFSTFNEKVTLTHTSPLLFPGILILILCLILAARFLYAGATARQTRQRRFIFSLLLLLAAEAYLCIYWQTHYDNAPIADQNQVWNAAVAIAQGTNLNNASYFILLPRQKAMALCFAVVAKLFGTDYDTSIRPLNAVFLLLLVLWNALLAFRITKKEEAGSLCALLTVLFTPLVFYTCFVYGTIPSISLTVGTFYFAVRLVQTGKVRYLLPETLCALLMVLMYSAAWLGSLAVLMILLPCSVMLFRTDRKKAFTLLAGAVLPILIPYSAMLLVPSVFQALTGIGSTNTSAPTLTWIVMGLSSSNNTVAGPGSYNQLPETVLQEGETTAEASARLFSTLKTILSEYLSGSRSLFFFVEKTLYQWTDPWFGSLTLTLVQRGNRLAHMRHVAAGTKATTVSLTLLARLEPLLVVFRTTVLLLALLFVLSLLFRRKGKSISPEMFCRLLPAVYFAGIFCFQLFWESKSRYCMPAIVLLIPLAAAAIEEIKQSRLISNPFTKSKNHLTS
ncbi:MAG: hypothetical protein ACOYBC_02695 [Bilifractor sp.]|jgi:hypothetical protein